MATGIHLHTCSLLIYLKPNPSENTGCVNLMHLDKIEPLQNLKKPREQNYTVKKNSLINHLACPCAAGRTIVESILVK